MIVVAINNLISQKVTIYNYFQLANKQQPFHNKKPSN